MSKYKLGLRVRVSNSSLLTWSLSAVSPQLSGSSWTWWTSPDSSRLLGVTVTTVVASRPWLEISAELQDLCAMMGEEETEMSSQWAGLEDEVIVKWAGFEGKCCWGVGWSWVSLEESGDSGFTEIGSVQREASVARLLKTQGISFSYSLSLTHTHLQCDKMSSQSQD